MLLVMALLALPPPSPGGALLDDLSQRERLLLAQSPDEERDLEQDMDSARKRLGHGEAPAADTSREPVSPAGGGVDARAPRPRGGTRSDGGAPRRRRRVADATLDGHGKAYYLTWGLVDWAVVGSMWGGATYASAVALVLASAWNDDTLSPRERRDVRGGAVVSAGIAAGLTIGGIILARRAGRDFDTFRDLRDAGRAGVTGEVAPRERDDDE